MRIPSGIATELKHRCRAAAVVIVAIDGEGNEQVTYTQHAKILPSAVAAADRILKRFSNGNKDE